MPTPLPQTCFGSLVFLRNSYSRITGPSIRRHLGVVRTTSITNLNSHRSYTSITPRSAHRHRYRVQPNHPTHQTEYQPSFNSERPPQSQPNLQNDFHKREKFVRRRRKGEEPDRVRGGFRGMSWKASLSLFLLLRLPLPLSLPLLAIFIYTYLHYLCLSHSDYDYDSDSDYDHDHDYDHFLPGERFLI